MRLGTWLLCAFLLGALSTAGIAWAKTVRVTFYRSGLAPIGCYLSEDGSTVDCVRDPCEAIRDPRRQ